MIYIAIILIIAALILWRTLPKSDCPDCGVVFACDACSKRYDEIDMKLKEGGK